MADKIDTLVRDARTLADTLKEAPEKSEDWYARNNLLSFVATIEERRDPGGLDRAAHALRYAIGDQWDWKSTFTKEASALASKAADISKGLREKNG